MMNFNINLDLLELECFHGLKSGNKSSTLVLLSFICWWTLWSKKPTAIVPLGRLASAFGVKDGTMSLAVKRLEEAQLIKCVKPYQRVGSHPGEYIITDKPGSIPKVTRLYTLSRQAVSPRYTVNNSIKNYNRDNDYYINNQSQLGSRDPSVPKDSGKAEWEK